MNRVAASLLAVGIADRRATAEASYTPASIEHVAERL
jgi:hypothetical protein